MSSSRSRNMVSELRQPLFPGFGAHAASALLRHDWPGNVRELKNAVERSVYRSEDPDKQIRKIAFDPFDSPFRLREKLQDDEDTKRPRKRRPPLFPIDLKDQVEETERELMQSGLEKARFNQKVAAELLGLSYHQLRGKMKKHGLDRRSVPGT